MITITAGTNDYELKATLGVSIKIEGKFKLPLIEVFDKLGSAEIPGLISILAISADKVNDLGFKTDILDNWDYTDLQTAVQELLINLMLSGTPEQIEKKLEKFPVGEQQKNVFREMLGLPKKEVVSTEIYSLGQPTE